MNMSWLDWSIVAVILFFITAVATYTKKYIISVADFLAANRCAGRYLLAVAGDMSNVGAISVVAWFELYYKGGFSAIWWTFMLLPVSFVIALSGWVIYRFRQTRAMTMAQFFEMRYSRRFRVFAGFMAFISGILNYGIFPAVGAKFFIYFCGLPEYFPFLGLNIASFPVIMFVLLCIALYFTFVGGQVAVMITDFIQGSFTYLVFIVVVIYVFTVFSWDQIGEALLNAPKDASLVNPFKTSKTEDFNFWFFMIFAVSQFYNFMSWQGAQGYRCAALNAHEARMGQILAKLRLTVRTLMFIMLPVCAYTIIHHSDFAIEAARTNAAVSQISNPTIQNQMFVPLAVVSFLPKGLMGLMCAMMLAAFISTHDTYLHSWGSIFIQDIIMPLRKKTLPREAHLKILKFSILGVAAFAFLFSLVFPQKQYILMWFAITGAIYLGGSGVVIIGGLYWKKGTTAAAWCAMITGSVLAVTGIIIRQINTDFFLNSQQMFFITIIISTLVYIVVSIVRPEEKHFNMDKLLHRGRYADEQTKIAEAQKPKSLKGLILKRLGVNSDFSKKDKFIFFGSITWTLAWFMVFVIGVIYSLSHDVSDKSWLRFWYVYIIITFIVFVLFTVWFTIGGIHDIKKLFARLKVAVRDDLDNGMVREDYHNIEPDKTNKASNQSLKENNKLKL